WYMQTADGDNPDAWNVWYRSSTDGGTTWTAPVKIDDAPAGAAGYVGADGFAEIYGDYGEIAVTNTGKTFAAWGEGFSYTGPGRSPSRAGRRRRRPSPRTRPGARRRARAPAPRSRSRVRRRRR